MSHPRCTEPVVKQTNLESVLDHILSKLKSLVASIGPIDSTRIFQHKSSVFTREGLGKSSLYMSRVSWTSLDTFCKINRCCQKQQPYGSLEHWPEPGFHLCCQCVQKSCSAVLFRAIAKCSYAVSCSDHYTAQLHLPRIKNSLDM